MGKLILQEEELFNFKQHKHSHWVFERNGGPVNLIGTIGPNGSGKSTILDALQFLFTGEIPKENKADLIGWADLDGKSWVRAKFLFDGVPLELYREAHGDGATLQLGDAKPIKKITAVNKALEEVLGIDKALCQKSMFVRQNDITDILFTDPAERIKGWQKLMGLSQASQIYLAGGNYLGGLPPAPDYTAELENTRARVRDFLADIENVKTALAAQKPGNPADLAALKAELANLAAKTAELRVHTQNWAYKSSDRKRAESELSKAQGLYSGIQAEWSRLDTQLTGLGIAVQNFEVENLEKECREIETSVGAYNSVVRLADSLEADHGKLEAARQTYAQVSETDLVLADTEARKLAAEAAELDSKLNLNRSLHHAIEACKTIAECPLCMQPVANAGQLKDVLNQRIADMGGQLSRVNKALDDCTRAYKRMQAARTGSSQQIALMTQEIAQLNAKKDELVAFITASVEQSDLLAKQRALYDLKIRRDSQMAMDRQRLKANADLSAADRGRNLAYDAVERAKVAEKDAADILVQQPDAEVLQGMMVPLQQAITEIEAQVAQVAQLNGQLEGLKYAHDKACKDAELLVASMAAGETRRTAIRVLEDVRNFFHHSQGPALVVARVLENITDGVNEFLGYFGAPFTVVPDFELTTFRVVFTDGRPVPPNPPLATVLSGGQRVTLALSFRLAGYFMFSSRLGFITIDEPTNHLDERNIENFRHLMERLKVLSRETGLQILISTHARSIISALDYVIDLGTGNDETKTTKQRS